MAIRKELPNWVSGGDNAVQLDSYYKKILADVIAGWKGNPTKEEKDFMQRYEANIGNDDSANQSLLSEAMNLNSQHINRVKAKMGIRSNGASGSWGDSPNSLPSTQLGQDGKTYILRNGKYYPQ